MKENPKYFLGIDFETQDADAKTTRITEVGVGLYELMIFSEYHDPVLQKVEGFSELVWEKDYPAQTEKIVQLTGITDDMLIASGITRLAMLEKLVPYLEKADVIMAHKITFDKTVLYSTAKLLGVTLPEKEWLCTLTNFPWPPHLTCHKLSHIAYEHGIMVDPRTLHRAEQDVDLMMRVVNEYDIEDVLRYAREPWVYLKAELLGPWEGRGGDGGIQTGIAKSIGYSWESVKGVDTLKWPKTWVTRVKESRVDKHMALIGESISPFRVTVIQGIS